MTGPVIVPPSVPRDPEEDWLARDERADHDEGDNDD